MSEKPPHYPDAANVDVVTAAIPLLQSHVLQAGEKLPIVEPPEYTEVDILDSKEATTEGNDGEEEDHWRMPELEDSGPSWSGGYIRIHVETPGRGGERKGAGRRRPSDGAKCPLCNDAALHLRIQHAAGCGALDGKWRKPVRAGLCRYSTGVSKTLNVGGNSM